MKRTWLYLTLCFATATLAFAEGSNSAHKASSQPWFEEVAAARSEAEKSGRFLLVDLYADWCGWCKRLEREVFSHPTFEAYAERFVKLRVNVEDGGEGAALQRRYGGSGLPTTLVLTPKMVLVDSIHGFAPRSVFIRRLDEALAEFEAGQQQLESLMARQDPELWRSLADDLHQQGDGQRASQLYGQILDLNELRPTERTFLLYRLADAQRLDGNFDGALHSLHEGRRRAERENNGKMIEAIDFLHIQITQDRGPCSATVAALQAFLDNHPKSDHRRQARRSLDLLLHQECT